jgi:hypothetical protein
MMKHFIQLQDGIRIEVEPNEDQLQKNFWWNYPR